jgi:hypothetical protein
MNKKIAIVIGVLILLGGSFWLYQNYAKKAPVEVPLTEVMVTREEVNLAFTYLIGTAGYSLSEASREASSTNSLLKGFVLTPTKMTETPVGSESELTISIFVIEEADETGSTTATTTIKLAKIDELKALASQYKNISGFDRLVGEVELVDLDGVDAIHYKADGLYMHDTYFANVFGNIYLIVGQYIEEGDKIHQDFKQLVNTVTFL